MPDIGQFNCTNWQNCERLSDCSKLNCNSTNTNVGKTLRNKNRFEMNRLTAATAYCLTDESKRNMMKRRYWRPSHTCLLILIVFTNTLVRPVTSRPQAVRIDSETETRAVDRRWDDLQSEHRKQDDSDYAKEDESPKSLDEIARVFRENKHLQGAIMEVLESLSEEDLKMLEELPRVDYYDDDELPQGDMPIEDVVEDSVQELPSEDVPINADLEGYKGELVVLDNINSTLASLNSTLNNGNVTETSIDDTPYPQMQKITRERNKEMRLQDIRQQILTYLFKGSPPVLYNSTNHHQMILQQQDLYRTISERMKNQNTQFPPGEVYTEKVQSFYPSCYVPRNTDEELWSTGETMNLWFDLSQPPLLQGTTINVVAAKLRLYKLSQDNVTVSVPEACPPPTMNETSSEVSKAHKVHFSFPTSPYAVEDKQIRVSIYWYTRSLKKHRVKRKLLDSQMLSVYGESWTEWNIRGAVKSWKENGRNFGLAVEVEDEDGVLLPAAKYFSPMNCSKQASISSPIPGFLARAIAKASNNKSIASSKSNAYHFNTLFPIIDLCTIESPESEKESRNRNYYHKVQDDSDKGYPTMIPTLKKENVTFVVNSVPTASNETDKHRIRHRNHHHSDENKPKKHIETIRRDDGDSIEEITWEDDLDGHQLRKKIIEQKVIMKAHKYQDNNDR